ncbi:hypothetical protein [Micromonospora trifolii]|uniref:hypothetical protein n=1 Tax=Micromonospora trifolii TaxID=2911208 RepID=UPI003CF8BA13
MGGDPQRWPGSAGPGLPPAAGPLPPERQAGVFRALSNRRAVVDCDIPATRFAVLRPLDGAGPTGTWNSTAAAVSWSRQRRALRSSARATTRSSPLLGPV